MAMSGMIRFSNVVIVKSLSMVKPQHSHWIFFFSCVKSMFVFSFFIYRINSTSTIIPVVKHSFFGRLKTLPTPRKSNQYLWYSILPKNGYVYKGIGQWTIGHAEFLDSNYVRPVLHLSCPLTILSCIWSILQLSCRTSDLSYMLTVLHPEFLLHCFCPVLHLTCPDLSGANVMWRNWLWRNVTVAKCNRGKIWCGEM